MYKTSTLKITKHSWDKDLKKWRDIPCLLFRRFNNVKMPVLPQNNLQIQCNPNQNPSRDVCVRTCTNVCMHPHMCRYWQANSKMYIEMQRGASLVAQWLRIRPPMQGTRVRALVREDPTCRGAAKAVHHNYWACALQPASHNCWAYAPQLLNWSLCA